jgi:hypothetical protein
MTGLTIPRNYTLQSLSSHRFQRLSPKRTERQCEAEFGIPDHPMRALFNKLFSTLMEFPVSSGL